MAFVQEEPEDVGGRMITTLTTPLRVMGAMVMPASRSRIEGDALGPRAP